MQTFLPIAEEVAALLKARIETIAIAESSSGGLIAASMLSVGGASAYFLGGAVLYTRAGFREMLGNTPAGKSGLHEETALALARAVREKYAATWGIAELGAAGPTGSRYGDPAGTSCIAVVGPIERAITLKTGKSDRVVNMCAFAKAAVELLNESLAATSS